MATTETEQEEVGSSSVFADLPSIVSESKTSTRVRFLNDRLIPAIQEQKLADKPAAQVMQLLSQTVLRYDDQRSRRAVEQVYRALLQAAPSNVRLFAMMFIKLSSAINKPAKEGHFAVAEAARGIILRWSTLPIEESFDVLVQLNQTWTDFVDAQALLLDSLLGGQHPHLRQSVAGRIRRTLQRPGVFDAYLVAVNRSEASPRYSALVGILIDHSISFKPLLDKHKATFLALFVKDIVGSKQALPAQTIACYNKLHHYVSFEDYKTAIQPIAEKMLLRSPEVLLGVLAQLLHHVKFDLSVLIPSYLDPLTSNLKSNNNEQRQLAIVCLGELARQSSDHNAVKTILNKLVAILNGVDGKLSSSDQRLGVVNAIRTLTTTSFTAETTQDFATSVIELLMPLAQKEAHEGTFQLILDTIGLFTLKLKNLNSTLIPFFEAGLKSDKMLIRRSYAATIAIGLKHETLSQCLPLVDTLIKLAEKVPSTPSNVPEGIVLLLALLRFRAVDTKAEQEITKRNILEVQLGPASYLFQEKVYSKISPEDVPYFIKLIEAAIHGLTGSALLAKSQRSLLFVGCLLSVYGPWTSRRAGRAALVDLLNTLPDLSSTLFAALQELLAIRHTNPAKFDSLSTSPDFATLLSSLLFKSASISCELIASRLVESIVVAHHQALGRPVWKQAVIANGDVSTFITSNIDKLIERITNPEFVLSGNVDGFRSAAFAALASVASLAPQPIIEQAINICLKVAKNLEGEVLSESDIGIFYTEEGQLFVDVLAKKDQAAAAFDRPRRGGAYSYEDELWEIQFKKEQALKREKDSKRKLTKEEEALVRSQLEKEAVVRTRLAVIQSKWRFALDIVATLANAVPSSLEPKVPQLLTSLILPLLASPLMHREAATTFQLLAKCVSSRIASIASLLPIVAMRLMKSAAVPAEWRAANVNDLVDRIIAGLKRAIDLGGPLPPGTFFFVFLVLKPLLLETKTVNEAVVAIAIAHSKLGASKLLPRADMIHVFLHLLSRHRSHQKSAHNGLTTLCENINDSVSRDELALLLDGLLSDDINVRQAALEALENVAYAEGEQQKILTMRVWLSIYDTDEGVVTLAKGLWQIAGCSVEADYAQPILQLITRNESNVRSNAGRALSAAMALHPQTISSTLADLYHLYQVKAALPEPVFDEFGRQLKQEYKDPTHIRASLADALKEVATHISAPEDFKNFLAFLINDGFADRSEEVRAKMLEAALLAIKQHGQANVAVALPIVENYLNQPAPPTQVHDHIRESVIILVGELAAFLAPTDPKVPAIISKLLATLSTPSEQVQSAVANCLPPLVKSMKDDIGEKIQQMLSQLLNGQKYGDRRGAAYGLAGLVKGKGISALKDYNIISQLKDAIEDKKSAQHRQGALFAYETLSLLLGRLFEPYVIQILPLLLVAYGDGSSEVREAVADASKVIMSKLSAHCVKLILPSLLVGLDDEQWRTKQGSAELLGSMAFLAPKQLSSSLPAIVPKLSNVLSDSHPKVVLAGKQALQQIGSVIRNPEIQEIVPLLLKALVDPNKYTSESLAALLQTAFVHVIDAPSLALITPILQRGLKERSTDTKKMAAQIMGNMSSLVDEKDFIPYLPALLPGVQSILVDPIPEVRKIAAVALGTMVTKMGEDSFEGLIPWLLNMLKSDSSSVDRSGAAQGLSEVLKGLGIKRLEGILPEVVANAMGNNANVREGYLSVLIYLPNNFGETLQPYLQMIIPPILKGLADESEGVRDVSLRAGQVIVNNYAYSAVELLLPSLQKGLFDDNPRIRQSSIQLLGDLLYRITGATGKTQIDGGEEDEGIGTEEGRRAVIQVLGQEKRDSVLAALYVLRCDNSLVVRQASLHVWKTVVSNTPRTMREILPVMMKIIIDCLGSASQDRRTLGAKCLGELVKKLGERVLPDVMPTLEQGLLSPSPQIRQGVCIGLNEIMNEAGKYMVSQFLDTIIPAVRKAICDPDPLVLAPAAQSFDTLYKIVGRLALDEILPVLLNNLNSPDNDVSSAALEGLQQITAIRSNVVFPVLIDRLLNPITSANAKALGMLIPSAGKALNRYLSTILNSLMDMTSPIAKSKGVDTAGIEATANVLLTTVEDDEAVRFLVTDLIEKSNSDKAYERKTACSFLATFCGSAKVDYTAYVLNLFRVLLSRMNDPDQEVVSAAWAALDSMTKTLKKEEQPQYIQHVRRTLAQILADSKSELLKGFCMPKGITPLLSMLQQGLLYGSADVRQHAAAAMGDVIRATDAESLKPSVVQMTGHLIRIVGDRFPWEVKSAILETLGLLLGKVGLTLKPFLPQLQSTFIRALHDTTSNVRLRAAAALGKLIALQPRIDPLITELINGIKTCDPSVRETFFRALYSVLIAGGASVSAPVRQTCQAAIVSYLADSDDYVQNAAAHCVGANCKSMTPDETRTVFKSLTPPDATAPWIQRLGLALALNSILQHVPAPIVEDEESRKKLVAWLIIHVQDDKVPVAVAGLRSVARALMASATLAKESGTELVSAVALGVSDKKPGDVRKVAAVVIKNIAKFQLKIVSQNMNAIIPSLLSAATNKEKNMPVKLAAERAMLYCLDLIHGDSLLQEYVSKADGETAKALMDYHKRVLSKLAASAAAAAADVASDDEEEMGKSFGVEVPRSEL